jgi:hypothetical protein
MFGPLKYRVLFIMKKVDLESFIGQKFNSLTIVSAIPGNRENRYYHKFECLCDCGKTTVVSKSNITRGHTKSCGCLLSTFAKNHIQKINNSGVNRTKETYRKRTISVAKLEPEGSIFGRLTVIKSYLQLLPNGRHVNMSTCLCQCGNEIDIKINSLRTGHTKSCGCLHDELFLENAEKLIKKRRSEKGLDPDIPIGDRNTQERALFVNTIGRETKERDNYTCLLCGTRGGWLESHHITLWFKDEENRFNPKNIATLCKDCHISKIHKGNSQGDPDSELTKILIEKVAEKYK